MWHKKFVRVFRHCAFEGFDSMHACMCTKCLTFLHTGKVCEKNIIPAQSMQPFSVCVSVVSLRFCPRDLLEVFNCHTLSFFDPSHSSASLVKDAATTATQFLYLSVMCEYERDGVRHVYTAWWEKNRQMITCSLSINVTTAHVRIREKMNSKQWWHYTFYATKRRQKWST